MAIGRMSLGYVLLIHLLWRSTKMNTNSQTNSSIQKSIFDAQNEIRKEANTCWRHFRHISQSNSFFFFHSLHVCFAKFHHTNTHTHASSSGRSDASKGIFHFIIFWFLNRDLCTMEIQFVLYFSFHWQLVKLFCTHAHSFHSELQHKFGASFTCRIVFTYLKLFVCWSVLLLLLLSLLQLSLFSLGYFYNNKQREKPQSFELFTVCSRAFVPYEQSIVIPLVADFITILKDDTAFEWILFVSAWHNAR